MMWIILTTTSRHLPSPSLFRCCLRQKCLIQSSPSDVAHVSRDKFALYLPLCTVERKLISLSRGPPHAGVSPPPRRFPLRSVSCLLPRAHAHRTGNGNHLLPHCLVRLLEGWVVSVGNARILATLVLGCPLVFPHLPHLPLLPIVLVLPHHVLHSESGNHLNILNSRSQNAITLSQDSVVVFCDISPLPDELWVSLVLLRRTGHDLCFSSL